MPPALAQEILRLLEKGPDARTYYIRRENIFLDKVIRHSGWSTDNTGALVGDAQVGVGWRKGDMQSSFGVIHREVRGNHMIFGQDTRTDTVAAFSFSIRPQK